MIRGILFDKDGTLIDFRRTWMPAYRGLALDLAARIDPEGGISRQEDLGASLLAHLGYDRAGDRFAPDSPLLWATNDDVAAALARLPALRGIDVPAIVSNHVSDAERYPPAPVGDLDSLFARLRSFGLQLGIATMDTTEAAQSLAARLGLVRHLAYIAGFDAGHGEKPAAGMVLGFCAATGLMPAEVVVVGDTRADLAMARAAGAQAAVAVLTGALPASALHPFADQVLDTIHDLEAWLIDTGRLASAAARR
ncbi:MAG TPA: HAD-IA family hydrolase [Geminicoccus sp.]|jgi:phosphoglycolate phosphatase|uniref:HAD family hydrolase n=1 Tax=Geminicoccus sp. TaxID=2024832 RepID=UPI002E317F43|nr:HAD-IA family hydrolase [Geminicoccus sp.]HEX2527069.1 HAD-IA family hydrolase [Geminicoccus sp.]